MYIFQNPKTQHTIELYAVEFTERLYWHEAERIAESFAGNWRMPTKEEMQLISQEFKKNKFGQFKHNLYWCFDTDTNEKALQYFHHFKGNYFKFPANWRAGKFHLRLVREPGKSYKTGVYGEPNQNSMLIDSRQYAAKSKW